MRFGNSISLPLTFANLAAGSGGAQLFTANGNHIAPRTGNYLCIGVGGGSGGEGGAGCPAVANWIGLPGCGGVAAQLTVSIVALNANDNNAVTIGLGGNGGAGGVGAAASGAGAAGGATTMGAVFSALGGTVGNSQLPLGSLATAPNRPFNGSHGHGYRGGRGGVGGIDANGSAGAVASGFGAGGGGGGGTITTVAAAINGGAGGNGSNGYLIVIPI
ncbi:MAG TPA: hypothetical protein VJR90_00020 [Gammaproteobacteria bacterium]|nr:hypothetical protein [Gammaproteobacteria bacterium]